MKPIKLLAFYCLLTALSCSNSDDDNSQNLKPIIQYSNNNNLDFTYFVRGQEKLPQQLDWQAEGGEFTFVESTPGLIINPQTGGVKVDDQRGIFPGEIYTVKIKATNSENVSTVIEVNIYINFLGKYVGMADNGENTNQWSFETYFNLDGTIKYVNTSELSGEVDGTWEFQDDELILNYTFLDSGDSFSQKGTLDISGEWPIYSGDWYTSLDAIEENKNGTFSLLFDSFTD